MPTTTTTSATIGINLRIVTIVVTSIAAAGHAEPDEIEVLHSLS
jgi:hypothetical protein